MTTPAHLLPSLLCAALVACTPEGVDDTVDDTVDTVDSTDTVDTPAETDTDAVDTDPVDTDPVDTDAPDTDVPDTDVPDTDSTDTDPADTDPAHTDTPADTDPADTDPPRDTALPVPDWGDGFLDLTDGLYANHPRTVLPGDRAAFREPDLTHGLIADLDGDGWPEVTLLGTIAASAAAPEAWVLRYDPATESLLPDPALTAAVAAVDNALLAAEDLDADGLVDLVRGRWRDDVAWGAAASSWPASAAVAPYNGGHIGGGLFDVDADGMVDLARTAGSCGRGSTTWTTQARRGSRWFYEPFGVIAPHNTGDAHTVGVLPLATTTVALNLGGWCNFVASPPGFFLPGPPDTEGFLTWEPGDITPANAVYKLDPAVNGGPLTRLVPMGAAVADLDGDGVLEVAIGTLQDHFSVFSDTGAALLTDRTTDLLAALPPRDPDGVFAGPYAPMKPWGTAPLDLDRDGDNDLLTVCGDDATDWLSGVPGTHDVLLLRNDGGVFTVEPTPLGLPESYDGRSLAVGDLDLDGRPDVVVGGHGQLPRVLLNRMPGGRPPIGLRLVGTTSAARGAIVHVLDGRADATMAGGTISPGPMSEPIVFASTTPDGVASTVAITWPSGLVQQLHDLAAWTVHTVVEPETLTVSTREAPADGVSEVEVRVTPRDLSGAARPGAVELRVPEGISGQVSAPVMDGLTWVFTVTAPLSAGYVRVEALIDGAPIRTRPRVVWTP